MKPAAFDYVRAETLDEALEVLGQEGSVRGCAAHGPRWRQEDRPAYLQAQPREVPQ